MLGATILVLTSPATERHAKGRRLRKNGILLGVISAHSLANRDGISPSRLPP